MEDYVHSYDHGGDPTERARLARQSEVAWALERAQLERIGIAADATVVDVGCGPGLLSQRLATLVPRGRVVGVDADTELLQQAHTAVVRSGLRHVHFVRAWASEMPLQTGYADVTYARFLLQHVPEPSAVVSEMARVCRSGGKVIIVDTDDGGILVDPEPEGLNALLAASHQGQQRLGGDRHIGRKLHRLMVEAGLQDVEVKVIPVTNHMIGADAWVDICLGFKSRIAHPDTLSPWAVEMALQRAREVLADPATFAQTLAYVAVGHVPDREESTQPL